MASDPNAVRMTRVPVPLRVMPVGVLVLMVGLDASTLLLGIEIARLPSRRRYRWSDVVAVTSSSERGPTIVACVAGRPKPLCLAGVRRRFGGDANGRAIDRRLEEIRAAAPEPHRSKILTVAAQRRSDHDAAAVLLQRSANEWWPNDERAATSS